MYIIKCLFVKWQYSAIYLFIFVFITIHLNFIIKVVLIVSSIPDPPAAKDMIHHICTSVELSIMMGRISLGSETEGNRYREKSALL